MSRSHKPFVLTAFAFLLAACVPQGEVRPPSWVTEGDQVKQAQRQAREEQVRATSKFKVTFDAHAADAVRMTIRSDYDRQFVNPIIELVEDFPARDQRLVSGFEWRGQSRIVHPPGGAGVSAIMRLMDETRHAGGFQRIYLIESGDIVLGKGREIGFVIPVAAGAGRAERLQRLHGRVVVRDGEAR